MPATATTDALLAAHASGPDAFDAAYAALRPSPADIADILRHVGRQVGMSDQKELLDRLDRFLREWAR